MGRLILLAVLLLLAFMSPTTAKAKKKIGFPGPCQCQSYIASTVDSLEFTYLGGDNTGLDGWCDFYVVLLNEQHCPSEPGCFGNIIAKGQRLLERTIVNTKPACKSSLFRVYVNPYLDMSTLTFGPYRPGEVIKHYMGHWFTRNVLDIHVYSGPTWLRISHDWLGYHFTGTVPRNQAPATFSVQAGAFNAKNTATITFNIIVDK
ncbi:hypothetical protein [Bradyrhizobium daqingense]|uniref:hypothetical protein n=1 Tax=Bradyrhizobium daqingense TaxID=993502 RepID=UPI003838D151